MNNSNTSIGEKQKCYIIGRKLEAESSVREEINELNVC